MLGGAPTLITKKVTIKQYNKIAIALIAVLTILNIASPALASRDDQTGDCVRQGKCKD